VLLKSRIPGSHDNSKNCKANYQEKKQDQQPADEIGVIPGRDGFPEKRVLV
jgi:hypothetical protein